MSLTLSRRDFVVATASALGSAAAAAREYLVYWGTYTAGGARYGTGESKGIYVSRLDSATGKLSVPELAAESANPSYLAVHPSRKFLYAVNEHIEMAGKTMGEVSAFSINSSSGKLTELNRVSSRGGMPCHVAVDKTGKVLATANWATGSAAVFAIQPDGRLAEASGFYQHVPEGERVVHCHSVVYSPDNRYLIETDTGLNTIFVHRFDAGKATIATHTPPSLRLKNPANPRHLVFHPSGNWAYVANEAGPGCTMLRYDAKKAVFEEVGVTRTVPSEYTGRTTPAEAVMHPSGRYVLISNRGHESIAVLRINPADGSLTLVEAYQPGGSGARSFNVDPTGQWLFALMQRSNSIVPLRFDLASGKLSSAGGPVTLAAPVCAKFV
jgi:6-phosphogluconolactonase